MSVRLRDLVRRRPAPGRDSGEFVGLVCSELADELPDEDVGEYLDDCLERYEMGTKPRCEEVEYIDLVRQAIERIERGH